MYEAREGPHATKHQQTHDNRTANSMYQMVDGQAQPTTAPEVSTNGSTLPHSDEVKHRTEIVTRRIQELWSVMQEMSANDVFVPGAERIQTAVTELTTIFPTVINLNAFDLIYFFKMDKNLNFFQSNIFLIFQSQTITNETIRNAIRQLNQNTGHLQKDCAGLQHAIQMNNTPSIDLYMQEVRNCAYNLAMATKMLVTQFQWAEFLRKKISESKQSLPLTLCHNQNWTKAINRVDICMPFSWMREQSMSDKDIFLFLFRKFRFIPNIKLNLVHLPFKLLSFYLSQFINFIYIT